MRPINSAFCIVFGPVTLSFPVSPEVTGASPCPINYELLVDSGCAISECNEFNNLASGDVCCYGEPDDEEDCPDLTVEMCSITCELDRKRGVYIITAEARVTYLGTETITDPIWVEANSDRGDGSNVIHTDLDPGDYLNFITECDETNNTTEGDACCD